MGYLKIDYNIALNRLLVAKLLDIIIEALLSTLVIKNTFFYKEKLIEIK